MHPLAEDYLARLATAAQSLGPHERAELLAELRSHLETGLAAASTEADVRNLLEGLGSPEDVAAAALAETDAPAPSAPPADGPEAASPWGTVEILAVLGLTVGAFLLPVVGPLVGLVLAWISARWTRSEKVVATVLTLLPVLVLSLGAASLMTVRVDGGGSGEPTVVERAPEVPNGGGS